MNKTLILHLPENVMASLERDAKRAGKSMNEIALDRLRGGGPQPRRGDADALRPFFGAWRMSPAERRRIERMIERERHLPEDAGDLSF